MTHRERVMKALNHEEPDRVPIDIGGMLCTGIMAVAYKRLKEHLGIDGKPVKVFDTGQQLAWIGDEILEYFDADVKPIHRLVDWLGMRLDEWKEGELTDGSKALVPKGFKPVKEGGSWKVKSGGITIAEMPEGGFYFDRVYHLLANVDTIGDLRSLWRKYKRGRREEAIIGEEEAEYLKEESRRLRETDYAIMLNFGGNLIELGQWLMGYSRFMMTLAADRKLAEYLLDLLVENHLENLEICTEAIGENADIIQFGDDFGMQDRLQISPSLYREVFKPRERKMWDFVRENSDWKTFLHSCGSIYDILPDLIDIDLDIINPVQISAKGMEPERLKREFGGDIVFWGGGCDTQGVLPMGTLEEIEEEVKKNISIFAPGGGCVFAAVHNVQVDIPPEKIVKLYESARRYGRYT